MMTNKIKERWTPVIIRHHGTTFETDVFEKYEVSCQCKIRNVNTKKVLSFDKNQRVGLRGGGIRKMIARYRVCLASFYPNDIPVDINSYDVDHIDGDHDNNVLDNLQWLTKSEHAKKTHSQTKEHRKSKVENAGKRVKVVDVKGDDKNEWLGRIFKSATCAAREMKIKRCNITKSVTKGHWVVGKYKFQFVEEELLDGEVFKPLGDYHVSNKGRVKMKSGKITKGSNYGSGYRRVRIRLYNDIKERSYLIHRLVWIAFNGPIPDGMVVMHDDTYNTLDDEGQQRNYLEDLSIGSWSDNMQSYHNNRSDLKRVRCLDNGKEYFSGAEAARELELHCSKIHSVCKKKRKTTGGYSFEYVN